jgi:hypothetical protein
MYQIERFFDLMSRHVFVPALDWVIAHPIISVVVVVVLVYWAARGYRML